MNILLVCSAGMSTSILVEKMRTEAIARGLDATIEAVPESRLKEHTTMDVILIGPQVRYLENKIRAAVNVPVAVIDNMAYGLMKGDQVLDQALSLTGTAHA
ncbi:PTS sugar transporter [Exiguobacterium sp. BMC-KP]|uniref:PTS sugar transporter subunit IIB n=1 Tax=Exiguobacterium sp. BMC-KP TaxID=1684312 RepID=UPI0006AA4FFC|nr:PTS sugar transporter subunit IIB [Exiguobacterium sp. BMC-KP]KOP29042.1 PTS sugar transporter [Exiguobacterium sp. BMC-KP]